MPRLMRWAIAGALGVPLVGLTVLPEVRAGDLDVAGDAAEGHGVEARLLQDHSIAIGGAVVRSAALHLDRHGVAVDFGYRGHIKAG